MKGPTAGCWQGIKNAYSTKLIKAVRNNIVWSLSYYIGVPVHLIPVYIPLGSKSV